MKFIIRLLLLLFVVSGCTDDKKEKELQKKEAELSQKEQELLLREKKIELKEQQLLELDTNKVEADSSIYNPALPGNWSVEMRCIETNCPGSAIGDTKNEQWQISYENGNILTKAIVDKRLVRVYSGTFKNDILKLSANQSTTDSQPSATMGVELQFTNENRLEGRRIIVREDGCRIVYAINLTK